MKIVFLAPFGIRPKGTLIARMLPLAVELKRLGHGIVIVAPPYTNPEDSGMTETVNGVTLRNISLGPGTGAFCAPFLAWRMFRDAMDETPDLVHLFKPKGYGGLAALLHLFLSRVGRRLPPLFVDCDDREGRGGMNELHPYSLPERVLFDFQERRIPRGTAGVTVASRALQDMVRGMGVAESKIFYLPNCASPLPPADVQGVRERLGLAPDVPVVILYTRFFEFEQEKLHFLFQDIHRRVPSVRFLVVGKGRRGEEELLRHAARERGFSEALLPAGWIPPEEIPGYLAAGDVALYPFADTTINRSKCPAKLIELLRAGVPVVADRVGQIGEYIEHGISGILCSHDAWQEMADGIVGLLLAPERRRAMGEAAGRRIAESFSWQEHAARLADFYRGVTGR